MRRIEQVKRKLHSRVPLLGGWLRRRAANKLAKDGSPSAFQALAEAWAQSDDARVRSIAETALRQLDDRRSINAVCAVWATTRHSGLEALVVEREWVASTPREIKVLTALKVKRPEVVTAGDAPLVAPLVQACEDRDPVIAGRAQEALRQLGKPDAREALCRLLIEQDHPLACQAALAAGYTPQEEQQQALFFFMTDQWQRYDLLDFQRYLLRTAYALGNDALRQRIREKLRSAGRTDLLVVFAGEDLCARAGDMASGELDVLVQTLTANHEWVTLWRLVFEVPLARSAQIVRTLAHCGWRPEETQDRLLLDDLASLVGQGVPTSEKALKQLFPPALKQAQARVPGRINAVTFSPFQPVIAVGTGQGKVALWNYQRAQVERVLSEFDHSIASVAFTGDHTLVCAERTNSLDDPCALYVWEGDRLLRLGQHRGSVTAAVPVGEHYLLSAGRDGVVSFWNVRERVEVTRQRFHFWPRAARVSPDGRWAALIHQGLEIVSLPGLDGRIRGAGRTIAHCAAFTADGQMLVVGKFTGDVLVYRWQGEYQLGVEKKPLVHHKGPVEGVEVLGKDSIVVMAGAEGSILFTALTERIPVGSVQAPWGQITSLHLSPDESFLAVGHSQSQLSLWDLRVLKMTDLLTRPFAKILPSVLAELTALTGNAGLDAPAQAACRFASAVLKHRFQYEIEIDQAPTIMVGEFDIEIEQGAAGVWATGD